MDNKKFEIYANSVRIGHSEIPFKRSPTSTERVIIETTSDNDQPGLPYLSPWELNGLTPADVLNGVSINIYGLRSDFNYVNNLYFRKVDDTARLSIAILLTQNEWHLPYNLSHFTDGYKETLTRYIPNIEDVVIDNSDGSFFVECSVTLTPKEDVYQAYRKLEKDMLRLFRHAIDEQIKGQKFVVPLQRSEDSNEFKWWVKYVIVPILGSGAFAAVLALLIGK